MFPGGRVVEEGAELVDIPPTLTDALGVPDPQRRTGRVTDPGGARCGRWLPRPAVASQYELSHTMRLGRCKLLVSGGGQVKLFDGADDLGETRELNASEPIACASSATPCRCGWPTKASGRSRAGAWPRTIDPSSLLIWTK